MLNNVAEMCYIALSLQGLLLVGSTATSMIMISYSLLLINSVSVYLHNRNMEKEEEGTQTTCLVI